MFQFNYEECEVSENGPRDVQCVDKSAHAVYSRCPGESEVHMRLSEVQRKIRRGQVRLLLVDLH